MRIAFVSKCFNVEACGLSDRACRDRLKRVRPEDPPYSTRREPRRPPSFGGYRIGPSSGNIGLAAEIRRARMAQEWFNEVSVIMTPSENSEATPIVWSLRRFRY